MCRFHNRRFEIHPVDAFAVFIRAAVSVGIGSAYQVTVETHTLSSLSNNILSLPMQGFYLSLGLLTVVSLWFAAKYRELEIFHHTEADNTFDSDSTDQLEELWNNTNQVELSTRKEESKDNIR